MIERFYAKALVGFDTLSIDLMPGLIAITGPSGAGKSVLMKALLALFGEEEVVATLSEAVLVLEDGYDLQSYDDGEETVRIRAVKKEKIRYYLNDLTISKKRLQAFMADYVRHIGHRSGQTLHNEALLSLVDAMAAQESTDHLEALRAFHALFEAYRQKEALLEKMIEDEKRINELIEFAEFEIRKIESIDPKIGEDEELMAIKRRLSKKEKIAEAIGEASKIFELEPAVDEALRLIESDTNLFNETMNQLRSAFERTEEMMDELNEIDVEEVLDRIEALSELKRRYGSIEEALAYLQKKRQELDDYRHIEFKMQGLQQEVDRLGEALEAAAEDLTKARHKVLGVLEKMVNGYLRDLRMPSLRFVLHPASLGRNGKDRIAIDLQGSRIETLSGGEFNRIRLALMVCHSELGGSGGVLLIDEIDANVSGDESIAIAKLLKKLSQTYQVIAISHQPHLSAAANMHIKVQKSPKGSEAIVLDTQARIAEISRMIAGEKGMGEAKRLAENLLKEFSA